MDACAAAASPPIAGLLPTCVIEKVAEDIGEGAGKRGREGFDELAQKRALDVVTFRDWQRIEEAEIAAARSGAPREKFVDIESMIAARGA